MRKKNPKKILKLLMMSPRNILRLRTRMIIYLKLQSRENLLNLRTNLIILQILSKIQLKQSTRNCKMNLINLRAIDLLNIESILQISLNLITNKLIDQKQRELASYLFRIEIRLKSYLKVLRKTKRNWQQKK